MIAEIWEGSLGWFGQLVDDETGHRDTFVFVASSRGSVIAKIIMWVPLTHLRFEDRFNPLLR